jgi:hypothetical protein
VDPPFVTGKACFLSFGLPPPRTPRKRGFGPEKWGSGGVLGTPSGGSFFGVPGVVFLGSGGSPGVPPSGGWGSPKTGVPGVQNRGSGGSPGGGPKNVFFWSAVIFSVFGGPGGTFRENPGFWPKVGGGPKKFDFLDPNRDRWFGSLFFTFFGNRHFLGGDPRSGEKLLATPRNRKKVLAGPPRTPRKVKKVGARSCENGVRLGAGLLVSTVRQGHQEPTNGVLNDF